MFLALFRTVLNSGRCFGLLCTNAFTDTTWSEISVADSFRSLSGTHFETTSVKPKLFSSFKDNFFRIWGILLSSPSHNQINNITNNDNICCMMIF